jgi:uncharacterized protein with HEPN domain
MAKTIRPALHDVLTTIDGIEKAVVGKSLDDYRSDWVLRHALQRGVEIVSEACRRIPEPLRQTQPEIPWRSITGIGNVLRHEYESVSDEIIWNVVQTHLGPLRKAVLAIAATLREDE